MERRHFLSSAGVAARSGRSIGKVLGANDRIVAGQTGLGSRGYYEVTINMRQFPTDHDCAVPTRGYQSERSNWLSFCTPSAPQDNLPIHRNQVACDA